MSLRDIIVRGRKSGQMELIGLVIIVILITLGMLFMAKFSLSGPSEKKIFTRQGLAYSTISTLMKTTVNDPSCIPGLSARPLQLNGDLLEDCATHFPPGPYSDSDFSCNNKHSCNYLQQDLIPLLLDGTLGSWNKGYEFKVTLLRSTESTPVPVLNFVSASGGCQKRERDASDSSINTDAGLVQSVLYICD